MSPSLPWHSEQGHLRSPPTLKQKKQINSAGAAALEATRAIFSALLVKQKEQQQPVAGRIALAGAQRWQHMGRTLPGDYYCLAPSPTANGELTLRQVPGFAPLRYACKEVSVLPTRNMCWPVNPVPETSPSTVGTWQPQAWRRGSELACCTDVQLSGVLSAPRHSVLCAEHTVQSNHCLLCSARSS